MPDTTILRLTGLGIPPYSARGLRQTLEPVSESVALRRTVNGALHDLSDTVLQKFQSTISGGDQQPPAVEACWPGRLLTVDCIVEFAIEGTVEEPTEEPTEALFARPYVPGSIRHADGFTFYRPRLQMRVARWSNDTGEYEAEVGWSLSLEEV